MNVRNLLVGSLVMAASVGGAASKPSTSKKLVQNCDKLTKELKDFGQHVKTLQRPGQLTVDRVEAARESLKGFQDSMQRVEGNFQDSLSDIIIERHNPETLRNFKRIQQCVNDNNQKMQDIVNKEIPAIVEAVRKRTVRNRNSTTTGNAISANFARAEL